MTVGKLAGRNILLVEDEFFQAREMKTVLEGEGARVLGPTGSAEEVPSLLADARVDAALVDINLGSGASFDTALLLKGQGVPFVFLTGYDAAAIPAELALTPRLEKPADERKVIDLLAQLI